MRAHPSARERAPDLALRWARTSPAPTQSGQRAADRGTSSLRTPGPRDRQRTTGPFPRESAASIFLHWRGLDVPPSAPFVHAHTPTTARRVGCRRAAFGTAFDPDTADITARAASAPDCAAPFI